MTARTRRARPPAPRQEQTAWQPLTRARSIESPALAAFKPGHGRALAAANEIWANDAYTVIVERRGDGSAEHLSIRRNDRGPVSDWRDKQQIKNELAGPETEAIELYPAESRVVDTANQFHLWCMPPGVTIPAGWTNRMVSDDAASVPGAVQRPRHRTGAPPDGRVPSAPG